MINVHEQQWETNHSSVNCVNWKNRFCGKKWEKHGKTSETYENRLKK